MGELVGECFTFNLGLLVFTNAADFDTELFIFGFSVLRIVWFCFLVLEFFVFGFDIELLVLCLSLLSSYT